MLVTVQVVLEAASGEVAVDGDEVGAFDADADERDDPRVLQLGDDVHLAEEVLGRLGRRLGQLDRHLLPAGEAAPVHPAVPPFPDQVLCNEPMEHAIR